MWESGDPVRTLSMEMLIYLFFQVVEDEDKPYNEQNINDLLVKKSKQIFLAFSRL